MTVPLKPPLKRIVFPKEFKADLRDYDFVQWVKDLDNRAEEYKRTEREKEVLNGKRTTTLVLQPGG